MPLTPFHPGPALLLGVLFTKIFNLWALFLGSIVMDIEPVFGIILTGSSYHGFLHTILGAIFGSLTIAVILWQFQRELSNISLKLKIRQVFSFPVLFFSALAAWLIHIFFDSLSHADVLPFWPSEYNPILIGPPAYWPSNLILLIFLIIALFLIIKKRKSNA
jgi:hypothetical protein